MTFFTVLRTSGTALLAGTLLCTAVGCAGGPLTKREKGALLGGAGGGGIGARFGGGRGAAGGRGAGGGGGAGVGGPIQGRGRGGGCGADALPRRGRKRGVRRGVGGGLH